jgi:hypothetical protein
MKLDVTYPRPITAIHQIEISSRCNLACVWCVHKDMTRPKMDMPRRTYVHALAWVRHFIQQGTQSTLNLAGIGESTLHPDFPDYLDLARVAVGPDAKLIFATNGLVCNPEIVSACQRNRVAVWVSLHSPKDAAFAIAQYRAAHVMENVSMHPITHPNDWAGQVKDWPFSPGRIQCQWLNYGRVMVMADGRIATCCLDATGADGILGDVLSGIGSLKTQPYSLCSACYQSHP